jgi:hypothetical protein
MVNLISVELCTQLVKGPYTDASCQVWLIVKRKMKINGSRNGVIRDISVHTLIKVRRLLF